MARFTEKYIELANVWWVSLHLVFETLMTVRRILRDTILNVHLSSFEYPLFFRTLIKLELFRFIFEKISNIRLYKRKPSCLFRVDRWTVIYVWQSQCLKIRNFTNTPKNKSLPVHNVRWRMKERRHNSTLSKPLH